MKQNIRLGFVQRKKTGMKALLLVLSLILALPSVALADSVPNASGPVPTYFLRYQGFVIDVDTGEQIVGTCVWAGPVGCPDPALKTDVRGYWALDFPDFSGLSWDVHFHADGYVDQMVNLNPNRQLILIGLKRL